MHSAGIKDSDFIRGKVPMTKAEIRTLILSRLELKEADWMLDIGAGTGAVAIEAARLLKNGQVFAVEKNPAAVDLVRRNCAQFGVSNLEIIRGTAPDILKEIPPVDKIFIGGSSGKLEAILETAFRLVKSGGRVAAAIVTLRSLAVLESFIENVLKANKAQDWELIHVCLSRYEPETGIMRAQNPVYIFSAGKECI